MDNIEQIVNEMVRDFTFVVPRPKSDVRKRLKDLYEAGRNDERETWINQPTNQYDQKIREAVIEECVEALPKERGTEEQEKAAHCGLYHWNDCLSETRTRLNSLKEKTK